jgi:electron transfer flavoprotein alpha subunit
LISPALLVQSNAGRLRITRIDSSARRAQRVELTVGQPAIVALTPGVAQPLPRDASRRGTTLDHTVDSIAVSRISSIEHVPADPAQADIRHVPKLIAGGKGVGGPEGFDTLRWIALKLGAGVAASRMAVDLGWIEADRQVGQTGKTVRPDLYIACGISGASHHLEGMADSRHVVAINIDSLAPLMQRAELAIQADLHQVLNEFAQLLEQTA